METNKSERILFAVDLDGTVLSDSRTGEIHPITIEAIKRAAREGHVVCILTGRPWRATKKTYELLGLNTCVVNYNGAYIHNPTPDNDFIPTIKYLELNDVLYILGDEKLQRAKANIAIEGPGWVVIEQREPKLEQVFGINLSRNLKVGLDFSRIPLKPTGVVIDTKKGVNTTELVAYLHRRYGDLCEFTSWSKGRNETKVLDITTLSAKKDKALIFLARYYKIDINRTIAIGDGHNDVEMLQAAGIGVAMYNAEEDLKKRADAITKYDNENGGVGRYINHVLDSIDEFLERMSNKVTSDTAD